MQVRFSRQKNYYEIEEATIQLDIIFKENNNRELTEKEKLIVSRAIDKYANMIEDVIEDDKAIDIDCDFENESVILRFSNPLKNKLKTTYNKLLEVHEWWTKIIESK